MGRGPGRRGAAEAAAEEGPDRLLLVDQARCEALAVAGRLDRAGRLWCVDAHTRLELSMTGLSPEAFASMPARERAAANAMAYRGLSA